MHIGKWAGLLSIFWLLLSGYIEPLLLSFGFLSLVLVLIVLKRMDDVDKEPVLVSINHKAVHYFVWLIVQIAKSSFDVTKLIWGGADKLTPKLAKLSIDTASPKHHVLYANSITLTPGTLCVDVKPNEITVHALQESSVDSLGEGEMERKITETLGEKK